MLPSEINFDDVHFRLPTAKMGSPDAIVAKGQTIKLPAGNFSRVHTFLPLRTTATKKQLSTSEENPLNSTSKIGEVSSAQWDDRPMDFHRL